MIREAIDTLVRGKDLTQDEACKVMEEIMGGQATPAQFGAFVTALRIKGETVDEIAGLAQVMRAKASRISVEGPLVDTCGTGGDGSGTFNISTAAAFVVAGAGLKVAKHGNRAMTSKCGSADVLEALGVVVELVPDHVRHCLEQIGIGFMFAPIFHPAMRYAAQPRREIGIRTVFNILGPLTNPAGALSQLLGVADSGLVDKMALVLGKMGCQHALVVHGEDGLDEVSTCAPTTISELHDDCIKTYQVTPEDFGLTRASLPDLKGGTAQENAALVRSVLHGTPGPLLDVVLLNAAAALVAGEAAASIGEGIAMARDSVVSHRALTKLNALIECTQGF